MSKNWKNLLSGKHFMFLEKFAKYGLFIMFTLAKFTLVYVRKARSRTQITYLTMWMALDCPFYEAPKKSQDWNAISEISNSLTDTWTEICKNFSGNRNVILNKFLDSHFSLLYFRMMCYLFKGISVPKFLLSFWKFSRAFQKFKYYVEKR